MGHDVSTVHDEQLAGHPDIELATAARAERRCLIIFDLDFANARRYPPPEYAGIVVLRLRVPTSKMQVWRLASFFASKPLLEGKLWIVDEVRARDWTA